MSPSTSFGDDNIMLIMNYVRDNKLCVTIKVEQCRTRQINFVLSEIELPEAYLGSRTKCLWLKWYAQNGTNKMLYGQHGMDKMVRITWSE